jgi:hypothetical protein
MSILNRPGWANKIIIEEGRGRPMINGINSVVAQFIDKETSKNWVYDKNRVTNILLNNRNFRNFLKENGIDTSDPDFHKGEEVTNIVKSEQGIEYIKNAFNTVGLKPLDISFEQEVETQPTQEVNNEIDPEDDDLIEDDDDDIRDELPTQSEVTDELDNEFEMEVTDQPENQTEVEEVPSNDQEQYGDTSFYLNSMEPNNSPELALSKESVNKHAKPSPQKINNLLKENYIKTRQHKFSIEQRFLL